MWSRFFQWMTLPLALVLVSGCASMQGRWSDAERENRRQSYQAFIDQYPDSALANEARRRIGDADYAFMVTSQLGTMESFRGFVGSHPSSYYVPLAKSRIDFLRETKPGDPDSYKRFVRKYPDNPFVLEAKASVPILWLRELNERIGVVITIDSAFAWRGISKGKMSTEELRRDLFNDLENRYFKNEGIHTVLMKNPTSTDDWAHGESGASQGVSTIIELNYGEQKVAESANDVPSNPAQHGGYLGDAMHRAAVAGTVNLIASLFGADIKATSQFTIRDATRGVVYCSGIPSLFQNVNTLCMLKFLDRLPCDKRVLSTLLLAANYGGTGIRWNAIATLGRVIGETSFEDRVGVLKGGARKVVSEALVSAGIADPRAVEPFVAAFKDRDSDIRVTAARALGDMKDNRAVEPLIVALIEPDWRIKAAAAEALGMLGDGSATQPLIAALVGPDWRIKAAAAEALGMIRDSSATQPLIAALSETTGYLGSAPPTTQEISSLKPVLESSISRYDAARALDKITKALKEITGEDFGDDPLKWQEWSETPKAKEASALLELHLGPESTKTITNSGISLAYLRSEFSKSMLTFRGIAGVDRDIQGPFSKTYVEIENNDTFYIKTSAGILYCVKIVQEGPDGVTLSFGKR
jgi:hypothetical protein